MCTCTPRDALFSRTRCTIWAGAAALTLLKILTLHFQMLLRLINIECCLVKPWIAASDAQSNAAERKPASSSLMWLACRKTPRWCGLDCTFPARKPAVSHSTLLTRMRICFTRLPVSVPGFRFPCGCLRQCQI